MKRVLVALVLGLASLTSFAGLETGTYVNDLVSSNPPGSDPRSQGADHLRLIKTVLQSTFPGMSGAADRVVTKGGNYTTVKNDNTAIVVYSAAATNTLTAAATVGNGYKIHVYANGGDVTLARSGADTINGSTSITVKMGRMAMVFSDGTSAYYAFEIPAANGAIPAGALQPYAGTSTPTGWLLCDGTAVSRTTYAALFAAIGTTWGSGDGSTTFNLPNLQRRTLVGSGGSATATLSNAVGNTGGEETHTVTIAEMPAHAHPGSSVSASYTAYTAGEDSSGPFYGATSVVFPTTITVNTSLSIASQGSGTAMNVRDPSAVVLYIVKY